MRLLFAWMLLLSVTIAGPAHAYLDPGTGAMLLQGLLGGIAGLLVVLRLYWGKVKAFFGRSDTPTPPDNRQNPSQP